MYWPQVAGVNLIRVILGIATHMKVFFVAGWKFSTVRKCQIARKLISNFHLLY
jgi:hypothetical protein